MCPPIGPMIIDYFGMALAIPPEQRAGKLADVLGMIDSAPWNSDERLILLGLANALEIVMLLPPVPEHGVGPSWRLGA